MRIGTLNFSSSVVSPYEFHEHHIERDDLFEFKLNKIFKELVLDVYPQFSEADFDWEIADLDLFWKNRFSPFYKVDCGVKSNGKMMNEKEFLQSWEAEAEKSH